MISKISKEEYEELCKSRAWDGKEDFHDLLENMTGIVAKRYTGSQYVDSAGNYIGDSGDVSVRDLLNSAYIEIDD